MSHKHVINIDSSNADPPGGPGAPPPYYGYGRPRPRPPAPGAYAYVSAPVVVPMPAYPHPEPAYPHPTPQPTYVTNHYYPSQPPPPEPVHVVDNTPPPHVSHVHDLIDWVPCTPSTALSFSHRAVAAGKEGWDGSPLWVIRAHHSGDLVPGKLAVKHRSAYIAHTGKEVPVHNFELLCAPAHLLRWLPSGNGHVPVGAIPAGNTHSGEPLYVGRVRYMRSITPGKIHPSHGCLYISFGGNEIPQRSYEVLCKVVG